MVKSRVNRTLAPLAAAALIVGATASGLWAADKPPQAPPKTVRVVKLVDPKLTRSLRARTWYWESLISRRHSHTTAAMRTEVALRFWQARLQRVRRLAARPPHRRAWQCIHRYEAGWWDGGGPYWGGLQMDRSFMRSYAPQALLRRGWANRWTPLEQMWVAERAHRDSGFWPWPNTARLCRLL